VDCSLLSKFLLLFLYMVSLFFLLFLLWQRKRSTGIIMLPNSKQLPRVHFMVPTTLQVWQLMTRCLPVHELLRRREHCGRLILDRHTSSAICVSLQVSCWSCSLLVIPLEARLPPNIGFSLRHTLAVFTRSAVTPLKVNRFGWNLEHSECIVWGFTLVNFGRDPCSSDSLRHRRCR